MDGLDGLCNPFMDLDQGGKCQAYYIWIDGTGQGLRCVQQNPDIMLRLVCITLTGASHGVTIPWQSRRLNSENCRLYPLRKILN